jgi:hypothetical protein
MANAAFIKIKKFDVDHLAYGIHKRLKLYIEQYGARDLDYYIAHLSHEIYRSHGIRGHSARQTIRRDLKNYAYRLVKEIADNIRLGCPKCGSVHYKIRSGFHLFGINKYKCNLCGDLFSNPIVIYK